MGSTDKICKNCENWHITYKCPMVYMETDLYGAPSCCFKDNTREDGLGYCDRFIPKMIEKTMTPIEWIDIKDRLPSNGAQVLVTVCEKTGNIYTDVGIKCEKYWFVDNELNDNVTHWAKLPQPARKE